MIEPIAGAPSTAAIVVVAADELDLQKLVARLERRYGTEYNVMGSGSGADAIARLGDLGILILLVRAGLLFRHLLGYRQDPL